jgi:transposase
MDRLKGQPLALIPVYLERADNVTGLMRLLSIGLRVLTLLEFVVRRRLAAAQTTLAGLYAGNPKRSTPRPTAERLLKAFQEPTLTSLREGRQRRYNLTLPLPHTPAHPGAHGLPRADLYEALCRFSHTALKMSDP